jgi:hypothetical protein
VLQHLDLFLRELLWPAAIPATGPGNLESCLGSLPDKISRSNSASAPKI